MNAIWRRCGDSVIPALSTNVTTYLLTYLLKLNSLQLSNPCLYLRLFVVCHYFTFLIGLVA